MASGHSKRLESKLKRLRRDLAVLNSARNWEVLIPIWRRPGWTTPAEFLMVNGLLDNLITQVGALAAMRDVLHKGSGAVRPG
jgi:hypothetical protein